MKKFTFIDKCGESHTFRPVQFAKSASIEHFLLSCPLSDSASADFAAYARKAHAYIVVRQSKRQAQEKAYHELFDKISRLCSCGFPGTPVYEVLDAFGSVYALQSVYRHHVAFCRGYVDVGERKSPIFWFYFGTFGGGFKYHEFFSTRYCYRHLILLSSWWFVNGDWRNGINQTSMSLFERFCKYGELPIES